MKNKKYIDDIHSGKTSLGIELGSTRIKGVLVNENMEVLATGNFQWENKLVDGIWTYDLDDVWKGIQVAYENLKKNVFQEYGVKISKIRAIGISAMMHGYLAFDGQDNLLVPFRTWRNAITGEAEKELTSLFNFNIPQRWSIAHLYQAILNNEEHIPKLSFFTTLAGYVHWKLTGEKLLGIGDASGMFPIDEEIKDYDRGMIEKFNTLIEGRGVKLDIADLLPRCVLAGEEAGVLTKEGARLLDPSGELEAGSIFAPPEGDAGTGMIATNSIATNTGNISAGTSVFAMIVLEKQLSQVYPEIDMVMTPDGLPVVMVHANNCTSEINSWVGMFEDLLKRLNVEYDINQLYQSLFLSALEADEDAEKYLVYGYHSGENITNIPEGRPLFARLPDAKLTVANFMRAQLESAFATLNIGMQILFNEGIKLESIVGHGGIFKTEGVAQRVVAAAVESTVTVMETADEGGAWGMAILAEYRRAGKQLPLREYLDRQVFKDVKEIKYTPSQDEIHKYREYVKRYTEGLDIERVAINSLKGN